MKYLVHYLITFLVFFSIDLVWLGVIAKNLYAQAIGHLMAPSVNWLAAILFYLGFVGGILVFVVEPALVEKNLVKLIATAALFGFITYSTYDLTNLATLKDWPLHITVIDLVWGTTLSSLVSIISYGIIQTWF